jgi:hypothetical protein
MNLDSFIFEQLQTIEAVKRTAPAQRDNQASEPDDCDDIPF